MADLGENAVRNASLAEVIDHGRELVLVPALGDTSCDIEDSAGGGEKVLALTCVRGNIMLEPAGFGCDSSSCSDSVVPDQGSRTVISASLVVMEKDRILIGKPAAQRSLSSSRCMSWVERRA